jgi:4'-phosphopantetheinyl transferase
VHLWRLVLDLPPPEVLDLERILATEELERGARLRFQRDRRRFIAARGKLRQILGHYLGCSSREVSFDYGSHGKPRVAAVHGQDLSFNLSHSHGLGLVAITRGREIGVDLEAIRPDLSIDLIAARFFSIREVAMLEMLPRAQRLEGFFNCWTRKEAYVKACGGGLSIPLDGFSVTLAPGEPAALLESQDGDFECGQWTLYGFRPAAGFVAALAVQGPIRRVIWHGWTADPA